MHIDVNNAFIMDGSFSFKSGFKYDIRDSYAVIGGDEVSVQGCFTDLILVKGRNSCR